MAHLSTVKTFTVEFRPLIFVAILVAAVLSPVSPGSANVARARAILHPSLLIQLVLIEIELLQFCEPSIGIIMSSS